MKYNIKSIEPEYLRWLLEVITKPSQEFIQMPPYWNPDSTNEPIDEALFDEDELKKFQQPAK